MNRPIEWSDFALMLAAYEYHRAEFQEGMMQDEHPEVRRGDKGALVSAGGDSQTIWLPIHYKDVARLFTMPVRNGEDL